MKLLQTAIPDLWIVESERRSDARGSFMRLYCAQTLKAAGIGHHAPVQINQSVNLRRGTLRGMHYQTGTAPEGKIVRCLRGRVMDVIVDLRAGSPAFLRHEMIELSADNARAAIIPPGCAHGFQTLEDDCELLYLHSALYDPAHEAGLRHDDPKLGIRWPLPAAVMSERDTSFPLLADDFTGIANAL